jgi:hypothetical protein
MKRLCRENNNVCREMVALLSGLGISAAQIMTWASYILASLAILTAAAR